MKRFCLLLCSSASPPLPSPTKACGRSTISRRRPCKQKYGVDIDDAWLDRLQRSIARLEGGCTGSFVSPDGLVLTNHHCAELPSATCPAPSDNLIANGFIAGRPRRGAPVPGRDRLGAGRYRRHHRAGNAATAGLADAKANEVRKQTLSRLESACTAAEKEARGALACESVTLYQGGQYFLYKYKRYDDVRLVFAPEQAIAAFGGDPDNFNFPRWCLDFILLRVYENGKPARTPTTCAGASKGRAPATRSSSPAIPAAPTAC